MHLAGETEALHIAPDLVRDLCDDRAARAPPVFRILFRPARMRRVQRIGGRRGGGHAARLIDRQTTRTAGSEVKPEKLGQSSSPIPTYVPLRRGCHTHTTSAGALTPASRAVGPASPIAAPAQKPNVARLQAITCLGTCARAMRSSARPASA